MNLQERRSTLVADAQKLQQGIEQAVAQLRRFEGAIALIDEQLKEVNEDGQCCVPSGPNES